jgi:hypothetical protein
MTFVTAFILTPLPRGGGQPSGGAAAAAVSESAGSSAKSHATGKIQS